MQIVDRPLTISAVGGAAAVPPSWPLAPADTRLDPNEIHVWCARLEDFYRDLPRLNAVLSPDERMRASRFHFVADRDRFIAGRGILRALLARYLRQDAATIQFSYGRFGKPEIAGPDVRRRLYFNISHSDALAVYAVTGACPIGVDVERVHDIPGMDAIGSLAFGSTEAGRLAALPPDQRCEEFFACWAANEARLKATGDGLAHHLGTRRREPPLRGSMPSEWRLHRLRPAPGYVGALACRHDSARLSLWRMSDCRVG
jgi:4'-phosphopantetheinyl transferase